MFSVGSSFRLPVPIGRVWRLLVDIERYSEWHPSLRFVDRSGETERLDYIYSPRGPRGPQLAAEGAIVSLDWLSGFAWRTGMRGVLVVEESYQLEKLGQGVEVTHQLAIGGVLGWLGYPFLRRPCRLFLARSNEALERHFRKTSVQSRYARPGGARG